MNKTTIGLLIVLGGALIYLAMEYFKNKRRHNG